MIHSKRMVAFLLISLSTFSSTYSPSAAAEEESNPFLKLCLGRRSELEGCKTGKSNEIKALIDSVQGVKDVGDYLEKRKFLARVAEHRKAEVEENIKTIRKFIECLRGKPDLFKSTVPKGCDKESFGKLRKMARDTELNLPLMQRASMMRTIAGAKPFQFNKYFEEQPRTNMAGLSPAEKEQLIEEVGKNFSRKKGDELPGPPSPFLGNAKTGVEVTAPLFHSAAEQLIQDTRAVKLDILKRGASHDDLNYSMVYKENSALDNAWAEEFKTTQGKHRMHLRSETGAYSSSELGGIIKFYNSQYESILSEHPYFLYMPAYTNRADLASNMATGLEAMITNHAAESLKNIKEDLGTPPGILQDSLLKYILEKNSVEAVLKEDLAKDPYPASCQLTEEFQKQKEKQGKLVGTAFRIAGWTCFIGAVASFGATAQPCMALGYLGFAYGSVKTVISYGELKERADKAYSQMSPKDKNEIEKLIAANKLQSFNTSLFLIERIAGQFGISFGALLKNLNMSGMISQMTEILSISPGMPKSFLDRLLTDYIHSQIFKVRNDTLKKATLGENTELGAMADTYTRSQQIKEALVTRLDFKSTNFDKEGFCSSVKNTLITSDDTDKESRKLIEGSAKKYGCSF